MPKPFHLQAVLDVRRRKQEAEERVLLLLNGEIQRTETRLEAIRDELQTCNRERERTLGSAAPGAVYQASSARFLTIKEAERHLLHQREDLIAKRKAQEQIYRVAHGAREMLTELRQQYVTRAAKVEDKRAQRDLDDIFAARIRP